MANRAVRWTAACLLVMVAAAVQVTMPAIPIFGGIRPDWLAVAVAYSALSCEALATVLVWALGLGWTYEALSAAPVGAISGAFLVGAAALWVARQWLDRGLVVVQWLAGAWVTVLSGGVALWISGVSAAAVGKLMAAMLLNGSAAVLVFLMVDLVRVHGGDEP